MDSPILFVHRMFPYTIMIIYLLSTALYYRVYVIRAYFSIYFQSWLLINLLINLLTLPT